jgi:hypothetical protein
MTKTKGIRVFTQPEHPTDKNIGWIALMIDDIQDLFTERELYLFQCSLFVQKKDLLSHYAGRNMKAFIKGGGIAEYEKEYFDIDFIYPLSQKDIKDIKNRAEELMEHFSVKKETVFELSRSDESMLEAIINGLNAKESPKELSC